MNVTQILAGLDDAEGLPREALRAATEHRAALVPRLIEAFDTYTLDVGDEPMLFFAFHLLGQWRETSAYRPLCRFLRRMGADIETAMGEDTMMETSHRVMAAVFDGDPAPLHEVIHDPGVNEYVRGNMCMALAMLTARGQVPRAETERFLRDAFDRLRPRRACFVWAGWEDAIVRLGMVELRWRSCRHPVPGHRWRPPCTMAFRSRRHARVAAAASSSTAMVVCSELRALVCMQGA